MIALNKTYNDMFLVNAMKDAMKTPNNNVDKDGVSLLLSLLDPDRRRRMTAENALEHDFFSSVHNKMIKFSSSKNIIVGSVTSKYLFLLINPSLIILLGPISTSLLTAKTLIILAY